jgi:hypothetical protein
MSCTNNQKQLGLAVHNFHDTYNRLPCYIDDTIFVSKRLDRFSFLYVLLPFIEQTASHDWIMSANSLRATPKDLTGGTFPLTADFILRSIEEPFSTRTDSPTTARIAAFLCPSDGNSRHTPGGRDATLRATKTNYRGSLGDIMSLTAFKHRIHSPRSWLRPGSRNVGSNLDGFNPGTAGANLSGSNSWGGEIDLAAITSGTSNTLMITEGVISGGTGRGGVINNPGKSDFLSHVISAAAGDPNLFIWYNQNPSDCLNARSRTRVVSQGVGLYGPGDVAFDTFMSIGTGIYTLLPPNSPSCGDGDMYHGVSASSLHPGGVNGVLMDGSVRFINETIHTKNLTVVGRYPTGYSHVGRVPSTPVANATGGTDAIVGQTFSYGIWAELGAINSGHTISF